MAKSSAARAPGSMRVEEDEQIDRPIAFILAIVALELARLGRDRRPYLADELGRALIETNYRALRIGRFGIEVEHILHAGNVFAIDLRNTPHILAPRLEVILGQAPTRGLPDMLSCSVSLTDRTPLSGPGGMLV